MRFSIIIPTHARPKRLNQCLAGLAAVDYPRDRFEVIVVDDASPDSVDDVVDAFVGPLQVRLLKQAKAGPGMARNLAAQHARGEWLGFLDDDCVPDRDWLKNIDRAAALSPGAMLGGGTANACRDNIFAELNHVLLSEVREWLRNHARSLHFFPSNNLFLPAADFQKMGGFDSHFHLAGGEDRELCARWLAVGGQMLEVPDAKIQHYHPQNLSSFLNMHFRYGSGAARLHRQRNTSPREHVSRGLYASLLRAAWRANSRFSPVPIVTLLLVAQAAEAVGYAVEVSSRRDHASGASRAP